MYTKELSENLKEDKGRKWRPSNGTEGEIFFNKYCYQCSKFSPDENCCEFHMNMMCLDADDEEYPKELCVGCDGQPTCTAFEQKE